MIPQSDPAMLPWEDSIKHLVLDVMSVSAGCRYGTCMLLYGEGYAYQNVSSNIVSKKYGADQYITISVIPSSTVTNSFEVSITRDSEHSYMAIVSADKLIATLSVWYDQRTRLSIATIAP